MSEMRAILEETCAKLFAKFEEPAVLRRVEETGDCADVWAAVAEQGLDQIFSGGSDDPWRDACVVLKACGRHVLPAPLPETLMANAILSYASAEPINGALTLFADDADFIAQWNGSPATLRTAFTSDEGGQVSGRMRSVPWARNTGYVVSMIGMMASALPIAEANMSCGQSVAREPRDDLVFAGVVDAAKPLDGIDAFAHQPLCATYGALMRSAQIAGCIEAVLAMTVQYARERQQFGKPIGSFQAIQHQLAILAGHSAAATRIVDAAFERMANFATHNVDDLIIEAAVAKIRCGEAAGVAASIAHQTHGAIGFTDEHRLHYYTRRLWSWRSEFGSEAYWSGVLGRRVAKAGADGFWPSVTAAG